MSLAVTIFIKVVVVLTAARAGFLMNSTDATTPAVVAHVAIAIAGVCIL